VPTYRRVRGDRKSFACGKSMNSIQRIAGGKLVDDRGLLLAVGTSENGAQVRFLLQRKSLFLAHSDRDSVRT
jgi:hypothetical protein